MITQTSYPGWLYPVTQGATTIWERWNSFTEKGGFGRNNAMNSFNHYSLGSVLTWLFEWVLGIQKCENGEDFSRYCLKPKIYGFDYAGGTVHTPFGCIESSWERKETEIIYSCMIPVNIRAVLELNGKSYELESGRHQFRFEK